MHRLLDWVLGGRCRYGCGQRTFPKDQQTHEYIDHCGDPCP